MVGLKHSADNCLRIILDSVGFLSYLEMKNQLKNLLSNSNAVMRRPVNISSVVNRYDSVVFQ